MGAISVAAWINCQGPLVRLCVVYVVKEVASFLGGSINKWAWHVIERALELYRSEEEKLLVAYAETETNSKLFTPEIYS